MSRTACPTLVLIAVISYLFMPCLGYCYDYVKPLYQCAQDGDIAGVRDWIEKGVDIDIYGGVSKRERTPLHWAVAKGHIEIVRLLIEHGAGVDKKSKDGYFPLYFAVMTDSREIAYMLINSGADVNARTSRKRYTALRGAVEMGYTDMAWLLIEWGADVNATDPYAIRKATMKPLHLAAKECNIELVRLLIEHGANVDIKDSNCSTPLLYAVRHKCDTLAELLIDLGADASIMSNSGSTPLLHVLTRDNPNVELAKLLINNGANVNVKEYKNREKNTVLHLAARLNNIELAELLIQKGAKVNSKNGYGKTPLTFIYTGAEYEAMRQVLISHGGQCY